jgi:phosphoglycerate kinase
VFLLGGAAANTLLSLQGVDVYRSVVDKDPKDLRKLKEVLKFKNIMIAEDYIMEKHMILDVGPKATAEFVKQIAKAKTILWSGSMGQIERKPFDKSTLAIAKAIAVNKKAFSVAGGGETVMFLKKHKFDTKFSFISTGGGAMMDFLAGEKLPGIEALKR